MSIPPNQTLYVKNLNEKARKLDLKKALYALFGQFGPILDLVAMKTQKMRGQAFIVFRDVVAATNAMRDLQNFLFFDKPMIIQYAKSKSDFIAKIDGSFIPREKKAALSKKRKAEEAPEGERPAKRVDTGAPAAPVAAPAPAQPSGPDLTIPPNRVLFVENLPPQVTEGMLIPLFQKFPGYMEVRLVPGNKGLAFVEFQNEIQSSMALAELQGFRVDTEHSMQISFQKRL